jgi:polyisoprenyl-teichoic acid--peptidoglycan teichoic acid transferase
MNQPIHYNGGTPTPETGSHGRSRFAATIGYSLLAIAGLATGVVIFTLIMLGTPLRASISIVEPGSLEPISLDEISLTESSEDIVPWGQGGRTRVYVHPDFPIKKVNQKDPDIETILIFGVDSRGASDVVCRADSLILLTIDRSHKALKLTSIMRDTQVKIAGRSKPNRINAAYAFGGAGLLINTLNETFELDIQRFAMFDFWSAENLIDSVGGIDLEISKAEIPYMNMSLAEQNMLTGDSDLSPLIDKSGLQHIDGRQAIAWARIRKLDSDSARAGRQRTVMMALMNNFSDASLSSLISLVGGGLDTFETNMRNTDMIRLGSGALPFIGTIHEYRVPEEGMYKINADPWMMIVDWDEQLPALQAFIWGEP